MVPLSEETMASSLQQLVEGMGHDLRLHRHVLARAAFFHQLVPVLHAFLRLSSGTYCSCA